MMRTSSIRTAIWISFLILITLIGCSSGPKVIEGEPLAEAQASPSTGIFSPTPANPGTASQPSPPTANGNPGSGDVKAEVHKVVVAEVLPTQRYVYMKVNEGVQEYWIAARKQPVQVGETYYFTNALLKTNFTSQEYDRTFSQIYLVSKLVPEKHGGAGLPSDVVQIPMHGPDGSKTVPAASAKDAPTGVTRIAELTANPSAFAGKTITLHGKVSKVNPQIMKRNWIHLQDGSADSYDLVITSTADVPEGSTITIKGVVSLNKDFGAGYTYALLVENGELIQP